MKRGGGALQCSVVSCISQHLNRSVLVLMWVCGCATVLPLFARLQLRDLRRTGGMYPPQLCVSERSLHYLQLTTSAIVRWRREAARWCRALMSPRRSRRVWCYLNLFPCRAAAVGQQPSRVGLRRNRHILSMIE